MIKTIIDTWKSVVFNPVKFFDKMPESPWYKFSLVFALTVIYIGLITKYFLDAIFARALLRYTIGAMILAPIILFIIAAVTHLFVVIFRGREKFGATFEVLAYAEAVTIFNFIPGVAIITPIWAMVITFIGIKKIHKLNNIRTIGVLVLPLLTIILVLFIALKGVKS